MTPREIAIALTECENDEFLEVFGAVTIADVVKLIFIGVFLFLVYKQIKKFVDSKVKEEKDKIAQEQAKTEEENKLKKKIEDAYCITQKYPAYHQESIDIRNGLKQEIQELRDDFKAIMDRLEEIEEQNKKRECSKLRDMLLQNYRYYTNEQQNPSRSWTKMESEAFWELFREYEEAGGNGYMHTVVQPAMESLIVVSITSKYTVQN